MSCLLIAVILNGLREMPTICKCMPKKKTICKWAIINNFAIPFSHHLYLI